MNIRRPGLLLLLLMSGEAAIARPIQMTLWISGGTGDLLTAGREAPGHLGVAAHLQRHDPEGYWIDVGGGSLSATQVLPRMPEAIVPDLERLQSGGQAVFSESPLPWTLLNAGILPQYPEAALPFPRLRSIQHPDGPMITVLGLLPADTPRRVPPSLLRPLRILCPDESLMAILAELRTRPALPVLALPEGADAAEWSRRHPDIPLMIEAASPNPAVTALDNGRRFRVRPGIHGRAVIRVSLTWDTLQQTFTHLHAEVEWVNPPQSLPGDLPPELSRRLRTLPEVPDINTLRKDYPESLLREAQADLVLMPRLTQRLPPHPQSPESWRVHIFPRDFAWIQVHAEPETLRHWLQRDLPGYEWIGARRGATRILLPASAAAGPLRTGVDSSRTPATIPPFTARSLLFPE